MELTLAFWHLQTSRCQQAKAAFDPPAWDDLMAVVPGLLESGEPIEGARYSRSAACSGWWLYYRDRENDFDAVINQHAYHITHVRPDLVDFLALPPGYYFQDRDPCGVGVLTGFHGEQQGPA